LLRARAHPVRRRPERRALPLRRRVPHAGAGAVRTGLRLTRGHLPVDGGMSDVYDFDGKRREGAGHEATLAAALTAHGYTVELLDFRAPGLTPAERAAREAWQRRGVDALLYFGQRPYQTRSTVEFKADTTAATS